MSERRTAARARAYLGGWFRALQRLCRGSFRAWRIRCGAAEITAAEPFDRRIVSQHGVIEGKNGFLFHRDNDALDQLTGGIVLRQRQIDVWIDALKARLAWCEAHGACMRMMIIPEKHVVHAEKLPRFIRLSRKRPAAQVLAALDPGAASKLLYPLGPLRRAEALRPTFLTTDTHWTSYGAFVAYDALIGSLRADMSLERVEESELAWQDRSFVGDLGVRFDRERVETISTALPTSTYKLTFHNHRFQRGAVHVYENERRDLPRCVLFRDSFSNALIPFLMRSFSRLVAISSLSCHYDVLEQEKPDVVLFVVIERFIATFGTGDTIELPQDSAAIPFGMFSGTELHELAAATGA